jgi:hypothetical protein
MLRCDAARAIEHRWFIALFPCRRTYGGIPQTPQRDQFDLSEFPDKFKKSSQKLVEKMAANANAIQAAVQSSIDTIFGKGK